VNELEALEALLGRVQKRRGEERVPCSTGLSLPERGPAPSETARVALGEVTVARAQALKPEVSSSDLKPQVSAASVAPTIEVTRSAGEPRFDDLIARALRLRLRGG